MAARESTRRFHAGAYCAAYDLDDDDEQAKRVIRKAQTGLVCLVYFGVLDWYWVWYGWREFRPHQGSLSGEAWFGAPLVTGEEAPLGKNLGGKILGKEENRTRWVRLSTFQPP